MTETISKSTGTERPPIAILGVPFDNLTIAETVARIQQMIESRKSHYLVTANVDFVVQAQTDIELRRIFADADLVLCDGTPLVWVSRLFGNPLVERVAGADIVPLLIEQAAAQGYRLFFLGATAESSKAAVERLHRRFPKLIIAGHYSPPFNTLLEMDHDEIKRRISQAQPDLLFVAFGCPKAEKWIAMHYRELGVPVAIGVGATIDFLAGQVQRAPVWMRRSGLEWIFRLVQEPRRLIGRYAKDLWVFGRSILAQWWCLRATGKARAHEWQNQAVDSGHQFIGFHGNLDDKAAAQIAAAISDGRPCIVDLSRLTSIDSTGIALLMRLQQRLHANGSPLVFVGVNRWLQRIFRRMRWHDFFACAPDLPMAVRLLEARGQEREAVADGLSRLIWRGEITAANIAEAWSRTQEFVLSAAGIQAGSHSVVIDLSEVRFIDSSGLGLMIRARKLAQREGLTLAFIGAQPAVRSVVRMARLEEFLNVTSGGAESSVDRRLVSAPI